MYGKCGRWMERKKRVVPGEVCAECAERDNHYREGEEPAENGSAERFGMPGRKQTERLLVYHANGSGKYGNDKRKTDKQ